MNEGDNKNYKNYKIFVVLLKLRNLFSGFF
jgi:hypothetical protein